MHRLSRQRSLLRPMRRLQLRQSGINEQSGTPLGVPFISFGFLPARSGTGGEKCRTPAERPGKIRNNHEIPLLLPPFPANDPFRSVSLRQSAGEHLALASGVMGKKDTHMGKAPMLKMAKTMLTNKAVGE